LVHFGAEAVDEQRGAAAERFDGETKERTRSRRSQIKPITGVEVMMQDNFDEGRYLHMRPYSPVRSSQIKRRQGVSDCGQKVNEHGVKPSVSPSLVMLISKSLLRLIAYEHDGVKANNPLALRRRSSG
jgi:hypothetical protein